MKISYYPGCTLKDKTKNLDNSTKASADMLGIELEELENWTCCGATYPLTEEKIANIIPQIRILTDVRGAGHSRVTTTCAFCYSTLKRANRAIKIDPVRRKRVNAFLKDDEPVRTYKGPNPEFKEYNGEIEISHFLEVLRDDIGWDAISLKAQKKLSGLKVAPYYGCKLLRPAKEVDFDDPENPSILENFLRSLGCDVVDIPFKSECCGSYLALSNPDAASRVSHLILKSAVQNGAEAITLSCPLCYYNLDRRQKDIAKRYKGFQQVPILFFTQLLAIALGVDQEVLGLDEHYINPRAVLQSKNLIQ